MIETLFIAGVSIVVLFALARLWIGYFSEQTHQRDCREILNELRRSHDA